LGKRGATGYSPSPLESRARVLAKQEEAVAAAGKVGVAPLPPLAWSLRIPARTWERWSQLDWREGKAHAVQAQLLPSCGSVGAKKGRTHREEKSDGVCLPPPGTPHTTVPFLVPCQWDNRKVRH
jgi:hypothetical protein